ncbi:MAG: hypothetical protein MRY64_01580 [Hyphomonadaceae bacterium]|nr:hypothetical protein [Hyphomonadaceae bacterium]
MIVFRQGVGLALLLLGLWMGWGTFQAFSQYTSRMPDPNHFAILADPVFLIPSLRALAAILGGALALIRWPGGAWLGLLSALLAAFLAVAILASGGDSSLWLDDVVLAGVLGFITLALILRKRTL